MNDGIRVKSAVPLSIVTCVSSTASLQSNLLASPCLSAGTVHEVIVVSNCPSAADGLNLGLARAKHEWVVGIHQDVFLPCGWDRCLARQLREAERKVRADRRRGRLRSRRCHRADRSRQPLAAERIGWVIDRGRSSPRGSELPARSRLWTSCSWSCGAIPGFDSTRRSGFTFTARTFAFRHARAPAVVALGALCHHNSRSIGLPRAFFASAEVFARKWSHRLPVATPCVIIDRGMEVHVLGNAMHRPRSMAYALAN